MESCFLLLAIIGAFLCQTNEAAFASTYTVVSSASASAPIGIVYTSSNDKLIMVENSINKVRVVQGGVTTMIQGTSAIPFNFPYGMWVDTAGNSFFANHFPQNVVKISADNNQLSIVAGTGTVSSTGDGGPATSATLNYPAWVAMDSNANLFIAEQRGHRIRKMNQNDNKISTIAGTGDAIFSGDGGPATSATMNSPTGLFIDAVGDLFVATPGDGKVRWIPASTGIIQTIAGKGSSAPTVNGILAANSQLGNACGIWGDSKGNIFLAESGAGRVTVIERKNNFEKMYLLASVNQAFGIWGDEGTGRLWVTQYAVNSLTVLKDPAVLSPAPTTSPTTATIASATPSQEPTRLPTAAPSTLPSITPSATPSVTPTSTPSEAPTLAVPEYSLTVAAKSFKYFEVRVFTAANERVFPVSYDLVNCPENAGAVIWGHASTPVTENTNTCVYGLPRHYWCECPALVNGNKPKLTLNFGGTVFDRVELLILDWVDGEVVASDSANNIVLFSASRAGGPLVGEEFVSYDHLNLLHVAPSVVPTITPSSVPTTKPSWTPTTKPSIPSVIPTQTPTMAPTTTVPSAEPSVTPSMVPSAAPSFTAQHTITLTAKTFKYFEVRVYTHDNLRIFPVSYELEHCPENAGVAVWNDQTTEDTNTCVYGYPRNFWCQCAAVADEKPKLVLHMGHTVFDRVELLLLNWEDGEVTVTDEANHETFLSATHDGVGNEFVTFGNLNLEHAAAPVRRLLRGG